MAAVSCTLTARRAGFLLCLLFQHRLHLLFGSVGWLSLTHSTLYKESRRQDG
jgi:hypothetical protein